MTPKDVVDLVESVVPELKDHVPVAFRIAADGEEPDVASAMVTADPIGLGFTLSQADLTRAARISEADGSLLVRAFGFREDPALAIEVRRGPGKAGLFNYHRRAVDRLIERVRSTDPDTLQIQAKRALIRAQRAIGPGDP